jgi:PTS system nitrogen regulatory IIA component
VDREESEKRDMTAPATKAMTARPPETGSRRIWRNPRNGIAQPVLLAARFTSVTNRSQMNISELLAPDAVLASLKVQSKKQLLQDLAARASQITRIPERKIFETLTERERLGSTGVGQGIAIPHGRLSDIKTISGVFARLESPIEYDAVDRQPVDLVFMLLAPEGAGADHLKALARVSRLLRNQQTVEKLRAATKPEALYAILTEPTASTSSRAA